MSAIRCGFIGLGFSLAGLVLAAGWGDSPSEFAHEAITKLGGREVPCKATDTKAFGPGEIAVCAFLPPSAKGFKKRWRSVAHGQGRPQIFLEAETAWVTEETDLRRYYRSDIVPIAVLYDPLSRYFRIVWTDLIYCDSNEWSGIANGLPQCGDVSELVTLDELQCPTRVKKPNVNGF